MSQAFRVGLAFGVSPENLMSVLVDEQFLLAKAAKFGGDGRPEAERVAADRITVRLPRRLPVEHVPGAFRALVGDGRLIQVEDWHVAATPIRGTWRAEADNTPVKLSGTFKISATADGCRYDIAGEVKVDIFAIGGTAERAARGPLQELLQNELLFTQAWIEERRA